MIQLGLDGMPARLFTCTPTRLAHWADCPRRYLLTYLAQPAPRRGPPWAHNSLGASVHTALAAVWKLAPHQRTPLAAAALLDRNWIGLGYRDDAQSQRWRVRAGRMVSRYVEGCDVGAEPAGVERTVAVRTRGLALSGRIDRLDRRGDELAVVDYKTGRHPCTDREARGSAALAVYAVAAESTLRTPCRRVELHHLPTGGTSAAEHTPETLDRHLDRLAALGAEAAAAERHHRAGLDPDASDAVFPARPSAGCAWCDMRVSCPAGQAVGEAALPWAGLADEAADEEAE